MLKIFNPTIKYGVTALDDLGPLLGSTFNGKRPVAPLVSIYEILSPGK